MLPILELAVDVGAETKANNNDLQSSIHEFACHDQQIHKASEFQAARPRNRFERTELDSVTMEELLPSPLSATRIHQL
jgi:hypothetical protein